MVVGRWRRGSQRALPVERLPDGMLPKRAIRLERQLREELIGCRMAGEYRIPLAIRDDLDRCLLADGGLNEHKRADGSVGVRERPGDVTRSATAGRGIGDQVADVHVELDAEIRVREVDRLGECIEVVDVVSGGIQADDLAASPPEE